MPSIKFQKLVRFKILKLLSKLGCLKFYLLYAFLYNLFVFSLYMQQMPEDERPIRGTVGAQKRRQRMQYQVDLSVSACSNFRSLKIAIFTKSQLEMLKLFKFPINHLFFSYLPTIAIQIKPSLCKPKKCVKNWSGLCVERKKTSPWDRSVFQRVVFQRVKSLIMLHL